MMKRVMRHIAAVIALGSTLLLSSCAAGRPSIPVGTIPEQAPLPSEEEQYGHQVLESMLERYPLDRDDTRINRVRDIVDRLTSARRTGNNPWHVYVLVDDQFANAAATRGNHVFVWTGILNIAKNDGELATVLAHEIGHVLAGHTQPTPAEEVHAILSGIAALATRSVLIQQGAQGDLSVLAGDIVGESIKGLIVNPETQRKELEADHIGLSLMAEAGYDPRRAIEFWERVRDAPGFSGGQVEFYSSHPSSIERIKNLERALPAALARYQGRGGSSANVPAAREHSPRYSGDRSEVWIARADRIPVHAAPNPRSEVVGHLPFEARVVVRELRGRWLEIVNPLAGFARSRDFAPEL